MSHQQRYFRLNKTATTKFREAVDRYKDYRTQAFKIIKAEGFNATWVLFDSIGVAVGVCYKQKEWSSVPQSIKDRLAHIEGENSKRVTAEFRRCKANKALCEKLSELDRVDLQKVLRDLVGVKTPFYLEGSTLYGVTFGWVLTLDACYITTKFNEPLKNCRPISNILYNKKSAENK